MKKTLLLSLVLLISTFSVQGQNISDLFSKSDTKIYWLGIDFSHVKLIGDFTQFAEAGSVGAVTIKNKYFSGWNDLILNESKKYDIVGMFRKPNIYFQTNGISTINSNSETESMEADTEPNYKKEDIQSFIKSYDFGAKDGIGLLFVAESLNKRTESGKYHFVAINLTNNEILLHDVFVGKAGGFGLRNYWARSYYEVINEIRDQKYKAWKKTHGVK
jgi:hypothetical protein